MIALSVLVRSKREEMGLSLQDLAEITGMSKGHIHDLEKGRTTDIKVSTALRLAFSLELSLATVVHAALFGDKEQPK